jgi:hypothetical protein
MGSLMQMANHIMDQGDAGRARGQETRLAQLMSQAYADPAQQKAILPQIAAVSPSAGAQAYKQFQDMDDDRRQQLGRYAAVFDALPDEQKVQAYPDFARQAQDVLGVPVPTQWDPAFGPRLRQIAQALGGGGGQGNVHSAFRGQNGNMWVLGRDGQVRDTGAQFDPKMQLIDTGAGWVGVNQTNLQAAPVMTGGAQPPMQQAAPQQGQYGPPPEVQMQAAPGATEEDMAYAMMAAENPNAQINVGPNGGAQMVAPATPPTVGAISTGGALPGQLTSAPKPVPQITPYQQAQLDMQAQRVSAASEARDAAIEARKVADGVKSDQKRQEQTARQVEASVAANQLVSAIDGLTKHPGFKHLGTAWGDAHINTPLVRNDAKDAKARLENIAGQVALSTMARLKALSATGATGFGSLTAPELRLLQNSIDTLQSENISNDQLQSSLKNIRDFMDKTANWVPQGGSPQAPAGWSIKALD